MRDGGSSLAQTHWSNELTLTAGQEGAGGGGAIGGGHLINPGLVLSRLPLSSLLLLSFRSSSVGLETGEWCRCRSLSLTPPASLRSHGSRPRPTRHNWLLISSNVVTFLCIFCCWLIFLFLLLFLLESTLVHLECCKGLYK